MTKKRTYARIARLYDLLDLPFEYARYRPIRNILFEGVGGVILDAGVGTGRNMPFYPPAGEVVGIDISPQMLARARKRRTYLDITAELREMDVMATDFPSQHFDYVIATFLFCVLDDEDQLPALRELMRVCKPDGEIRIIEYTYPRTPLKRFLMHLWAPWVRLAYGAAFDRHTEQYVEAAGLQLVEEHLVLQDIIKLLVLRPR
jgi:ubiquinone/menaquinone biosynthesis C-methylase UbiE